MNGNAAVPLPLPTLPNLPSPSTAPATAQQANPGGDGPTSSQKNMIQIQQRLMSDLIFPHHISKKMHARVDGMVRILQILKEDSSLKADKEGKKKDGKGEKKASFTSDELRKMKRPSLSNDGDPSPFHQAIKIDKSCRQFKVKSLQAHLNALRAKKEMLGSAVDSGDGKTVVVADHLRLKFEEEKARSQIHVMNYRHCIAQVACPERTGRMINCWSAISPNTMKAVVQAQFDGLLCRDEREAVERCCGAAVERLMKAATDE